MTYRDLIPPILHRRPKPNPTFASYAEALNACGKGYEDPELARVVLEKTKTAVGTGSFRVADPYFQPLTLLAITATLARENISVLDFGGAFGTSYFLVREALSVLGLDVRWAVVESPTFARLGRELETDSLRFFDSVETAHGWLGELHLIYASGAIQSLPAPEDTLRELVGLQPNVFALLRTLFAPIRRVEVQTSLLSENGPGPLPEGVADREVRYPRTLIPESVIHRALSDYHLITRAEHAFIWIKDRPCHTTPR